MAMTLDQIMTGLNSSGYDAQRGALQGQIDALPGQQAADLAGLDQAKTNAFGQITSAANAQGMTYSGQPLDQQAKYVGATYLPAVANLQNTYATNRSQLAGALGTLNANEYKDAQSTLSAQQTADANTAAKEQQMELAQMRYDLSASKAAQPSAADKATALQTSLNSDIQGAFNGFGARPTYYTENTIIPQLTRAYPELTAADIAKQVYAYRQSIGLH